MERITLDDAKRMFEDHLPPPITEPELFDTDIAQSVEWLLSEEQAPARSKKLGLGSIESSRNS